MQPFLVRLGFVTPPIIGHPITLDAILIGELALHVGDEEALANPPLATRDGVHQASQVYLDALNWRVPVVKINKRQSEARSAPIERLRGNGRGDTIVTSHNHQKNTLNSYQAQVARAAYFAGVGDLDEVRTLLEDARAIGVRRADGMGLIGEVWVEPVEADPATWGLMDGDGEPMRPVPVALWERLGGVADPLVQATRARPFYWDDRTPVEPCAVPPDTQAARLLRSLGL